MWKIMSSYGIDVECIQRVGFLFELVQNWSPTAIPDIPVCIPLFTLQIPTYIIGLLDSRGAV